MGPCDVTSHPGEKQYLSYSHDKKLRTEFTLLFYPFQGNLVHSSVIPHHWIGWASCGWQLSTPVAKLGTVVHVSVPSCKPTLQTGRSAGDIWHGKRKGGSVFDIKVYNCGKKVVIGRNKLNPDDKFLDLVRYQELRVMSWTSCLILLASYERQKILRWV